MSGQNLFDKFISNSLRVISSSLKESKLSIHEKRAQISYQSIERLSGSIKYLDDFVAERVAESFLILEDTGAISPESWCVFSACNIDRSRSEWTFKFRGRIPESYTPAEFLSSAYTNILMRDIDPEGREVYGRLLEDRHIVRRDVLKILASSGEAKELGFRLIIVPEPSSWLSDGEPGNSVYPTSQDLVVHIENNE